MTTSHKQAATKLLPLALKHAEHDEYIKGKYWDDEQQRGCSVGCSIHDAIGLGLLPEQTDHESRHALADLLFGGCRQIAALQDMIYEGLPDPDASQWTPRLLRAVAEAPDDTDWTRVWHRLAEGMLGDLLKLDSMTGDVASAVDHVRRCHETAARGEQVPDGEWAAAARAAVAATARATAWTAARDAAGDAAWAAAGDVAWIDAWDDYRRHADRLIEAIQSQSGAKS